MMEFIIHAQNVCISVHIKSEKTHTNSVLGIRVGGHFGAGVLGVTIIAIPIANFSLGDSLNPFSRSMRQPPQILLLSASARHDKFPPWLRNIRRIQGTSSPSRASNVTLHIYQRWLQDCRGAQYRGPWPDLWARLFYQPYTSSGDCKIAGSLHPADVPVINLVGTWWTATYY